MPGIATVAGPLQEGEVNLGGTPLSPDQVSQLDRVVRALAGKLRARLPGTCGIEMADLLQAGNVGLLQAARSYEPSRGAPLAGYAKYRIRGEMLDLVRRNLGREQTMPAMPRDDDGAPDWESRIPAHADSSPQAGVLNRQRLAIIVEEVDRLPEKYRTVVRLRYSREMTLRQIGTALSVNESRACQIHQRALHRLKCALWKRGVKHMSHL